MINGIAKFDKPAGWTSFDVVNKVRGTLEKELREKTGQRRRLKVGHSGTLDPFATGLLVIAYGECTKKLQNLIKQDKEYEGVIVFGAYSSTGDIEGEVIKSPKKPDIQQSDVEQAFKSFVGSIQQVPPEHSAIKVDGVRAYKLARRGEKVELKPRQVKVYKFTLLKFSYPKAHFRVRVSSGTYIRSLAMDVGKTLHTDAYLEELRRIKIADTEVEGALDPQIATYEEIISTSKMCT